MPFMSCMRALGETCSDACCTETLRAHQVQVVVLQAVRVGLGRVDWHLRAVHPLWHVLYAVLDDLGVPAGAAELSAHSCSPRQAEQCGCKGSDRSLLAEPPVEGGHSHGLLCRWCGCLADQHSLQAVVSFCPVLLLFELRSLLLQTLSSRASFKLSAGRLAVSLAVTGVALP